MKRLLITLTAALLVPASASAASLPKTPTPGGLGPRLQIKPHVFTTTGDGSAYLGGFTGHHLEPRHLGDIGRLTWTRYGAGSATASGQIWGAYGLGSVGGDRRFEDQGHVSVRASDPVGGIFRSLTVHTAPETFEIDGGRTVRHRASTTTFDAIHEEQFWYWTSPIDVDLAHVAKPHSCPVASLDRRDNGVVAIQTNVSCKTANYFGTFTDASQPFRWAGHRWQARFEQRVLTFRSGDLFVRIRYGAPAANSDPSSRSRVRVPSDGSRPQYKPAIITTSGDGSSYFGGRTGQSSEPSAAAFHHQLGSLHWTSYGSTTAKADGVDWVKLGPDPTAAEHFKLDGRVSLFLSDPVDNVFRRMTVVIHFDRAPPYDPSKLVTVRRIYRDGYWSGPVN